MPVYPRRRRVDTRASKHGRLIMSARDNRGNGPDPGYWLTGWARPP